MNEIMSFKRNKKIKLWVAPTNFGFNQSQSFFPTLSATSLRCQNVSVYIFVLSCFYGFLSFFVCLCQSFNKFVHSFVLLCISTSKRMLAHAITWSKTMKNALKLSKSTFLSYAQEALFFKENLGEGPRRGLHGIGN